MFLYSVFLLKLQLYSIQIHLLQPKGVFNARNGWMPFFVKPYFHDIKADIFFCLRYVTKILLGGGNEFSLFASIYSFTRASQRGSCAGFYLHKYQPPAPFFHNQVNFSQWCAVVLLQYSKAFLFIPLCSNFLPFCPHNIRQRAFFHITHSPVFSKSSCGKRVPLHKHPAIHSAI